MKILFFTRLFYPHIGGVEKHVWELTKRLEDKGYTVTIVTESLSSTQSQPDATSTVPHINATIYRIPVGTDEKRKKFLIWKWLYQHRALIKEADIIHAHDVFFWYLPYRFIFPRKKVFTTFHGYESFPIRNKAIIYRKLFEILSNGSICVGEFMKKWYHADPDFIIYGATAMPETVQGKIKQHAAIFIGRLDDQTGIDIYAKALQQIRRKFDSSFVLTVYGDGPFKKSLSAIEGIHIKGFNADAAANIGNFHFAFISRYLAILEALTHKTPVIAVYDNEVKKDYLEMTPFVDFISIVGSSNEVVEKVKSMLLNPNRTKKMVDAGYAWARTQTWEHLANLYEDLWSGKTEKK